METLFLKKGEERRLRAGHLWVFSNEVDVRRSPLSSFEPGQDVLVADAQGHVLGTAYVNPASLITGAACKPGKTSSGCRASAGTSDAGSFSAGAAF